MNTAPAVAPSVPFVKFTMSADLTDADLADMQRFIDFAVENGIVRGKVSARDLLRSM
jgi:hypothetical protein